MGKIVVIYNDIAEINRRLQEQKLPFKLHMRDACGSQSLWLEELDASSCSSQYDEMQRAIIDYFTEKNIVIEFLDNHLDFVIL